MPRFANGYDLPTAIIVGMLAEDPSVDRQELVLIAVCLALRDEGADRKQQATNHFQPNLALLDKVKMPDLIHPEEAWRWRNAGFKAIAEGTKQFLEEIAAEAESFRRLPAVARAAEAFNTSLWVELLKSKLNRERKLAEKTVKKALTEQ